MEKQKTSNSQSNLEKEEWPIKEARQLEGTEATGVGKARLNTVLPGQEACPISRDQRRACVGTLGPCPSGGRKDEKTVAEAGDQDEVSKESACNAGDLGSISRLGRSPGEGHSNLLQYSCLENPMDRGA